MLPARWSLVAAVAPSGSPDTDTARDLGGSAKSRLRWLSYRVSSVDGAGRFGVPAGRIDGSPQNQNRTNSVRNRFLLSEQPERHTTPPTPCVACHRL